jgi:hypothetical protein
MGHQPPETGTERNPLNLLAGQRAPDARHWPAQIPDAKISVCHGVGGMFAASGTIIMSNEPS